MLTSWSDTTTGDAARVTQAGTSEAASGSGGGAVTSMSENSCSSSGDLPSGGKTV
jgi:hypothetical protein